MGGDRIEKKQGGADWIDVDADKAGLGADQNLAGPADVYSMSEDEVRYLANTILRAREHFKQNGVPESRVSLREVKRVGDYLELFGDVENPLSSMLEGLWFVLGMDMFPEQIADPLGQGLITLMTQGEKQAEAAELLRGIIEPQEMTDTMFDVTGVSSVDEALYKLARRGTGWDYFGHLNFVLVRIYLASVGLSDEPFSALFQAIGKGMPFDENYQDDYYEEQNLRAVAFANLSVHPKSDYQKLFLAIQDSGASDERKDSALAILARHPQSDFQNLFNHINWRRLLADDSDAFAILAQHPHANFWKFYTEIKGWMSDNYDEAAVAFAKLAVHPAADYQRLCKAIWWTATNRASESDAFAILAQQPHADFQKLCHAIQGSKASPDTKARAFVILDQRPHADFQKLFKAIKGAGIREDANFKAFTALAQHPQSDFQQLFKAVQEWGARPDIKASVFAKLAKHPRADIPQLIAAIEGSGANAKTKAEAFAKLAKHPRADLGLLRASQLIQDVSLILTRMRDLSLQSADEGSRVGWAKAQDLAKPLAVLARRLGLTPKVLASDGGPSEKALLPTDDFDFTLKTAYQLAERTIKALALNRFVLITGDPASGKTEVGRFIAEVLNWPTTIVNAHRYLSEEELMQKLGVELVEDKTRFMVTDGPLARALIGGHLFILNEVHNSRSGSLAFLMKVLADVEGSFFYYDPKKREIVEKPIHRGFRMIATRNRTGQAMNAALKNRAIELAAKSYPSIELRALVRRRYHSLSEQYGSQFIEQLVSLYEGMGRQIAARLMGGNGAEGLVWNLRHLLRLAEAFSKLKAEAINPQSLLQAGMDAVGQMLENGDRRNFYDLMRNPKYGELSISERDIQEFMAHQETLSFDEVFEEFQLDKARGQEILTRHKISDIPTTARWVRAVMQAIKRGYHPWLRGPAGTGKTQAVLLATEFLGIELERDTLSPQTGPERLKGEIKPVILEDGKVGFKNIPGALIRGLKAATDKPDKRYAVFLDEAGFARPDVMEEFNSLLDRNGSIWAMNDAGELEELKLPGNLTLMWASNNYGHEGVQLQTDAFRSRTLEISAGFEFSVEELMVLLGADRSVLTKNKSGTTQEMPATSGAKKKPTPGRKRKGKQGPVNEWQSQPVPSNGSGVATWLASPGQEGPKVFSTACLPRESGDPAFLEKPGSPLSRGRQLDGVFRGAVNLTSQAPMAPAVNTQSKIRQAHLDTGINSGNHGAARLVAHSAGSWGRVGAVRAVALRRSPLRGY